MQRNSKMKFVHCQMKEGVYKLWSVQLKNTLMYSTGAHIRTVRVYPELSWNAWYIEGSQTNGYTMSSAVALNQDFPRLSRWVIKDLFGVAANREHGVKYDDPLQWKYFPFPTRSHYKQETFSFWCQQDDKKKTSKKTQVLIQVFGANLWLHVHVHDNKRVMFNAQPLSTFVLERIAKPSKPPVFSEHSMHHTIPRDGIMT